MTPVSRRAAAVVLGLVVACSTSVADDPSIPSWVTTTPRDADSLYFVGRCEALSPAEALRCAKTDALADLNLWAGGLLTSSIRSVSTDSGRRDTALFIFRSEIPARGVRIVDESTWTEGTGPEVTIGAAVLIGWSRYEAEASRRRIRESGDRTEALRAASEAAVERAAKTGEWGGALSRVCGAAGSIAQSVDPGRRAALQQLAHHIETLAGGLELEPASDSQKIAVRALYGGKPASDVQLICESKEASTRVVTDASGVARCTGSSGAGYGMGVVVRVDASACLALLPDGTPSEVTVAAGRLLDRQIEVGGVRRDRKTVEVVSAGICPVSEGAARKRFQQVLGEPADGSDRDFTLMITCETRTGSVGNLASADATGRITLQMQGTADRSDPVLDETIRARGLGTSPEEAIVDAQESLGERAADSVLAWLDNRDS